jgi:PAS domain S-box-containing protein
VGRERVEENPRTEAVDPTGFSAPPFGTFRYDVHDGRMSWSDAFSAILGFVGADISPSLDVLTAHQHPDDRALLAEGLQRLLESGEPLARRYRIVDARRQLRFVLATATAELDGAGNVAAVSGFLVDLTEGLRDYNADQVTRAVLRSAESRPTIEQAKGIVMASFDLTDEQAFNLLRLHSSYSNVKLRDVAAAVVQGIADPVLAALPPRPRVAGVLAALAGDRLPVLPVPRGGLSAPDLDRAAQSVSKGIASADLPRTLVRAIAGAGLSITIADFLAPDHPLVYANDAFAKLTGYPADDIVGSNCRFLQGPDTDRAAVADLRRALVRGEDVLTVLRNYRRDGSAFWNELHLAAVRDETGLVTHYIGYQVDVSDRVEREQQLRQLAHFDLLDERRAGD